MLCAVCKNDLVRIGQLDNEIGVSIPKAAPSGEADFLITSPEVKAITNLVVSLYACPQCKRVYANI